MSSVAYQSRFLEVDAVVGLSRLRFATRHIVEGPYFGKHRSKRQGGSVEFADFRQYTPGEDLRKLDWKVLARLRRPYIRICQEETNLLCTLVLDTSGSMLFGAKSEADTSGSKLDYARFLAASLGFVITREQDQVGLVTVSDALHEVLPCGASTNHFRRFLHLLEEVEPRPGTRLGAGLRSLFPLLPQRGVLVVLSDFLDDDLDAIFSAFRLFRHRHFEIICLHIVHPLEEHLPEGRSYRFVGLENDGVIVSSPAEIAEAYERRFAKFLSSVRTLAGATGCDYRRLSTASRYTRALESFLVEREG